MIPVVSRNAARNLLRASLSVAASNNRLFLQSEILRSCGPRALRICGESDTCSSKAGVISVSEFQRLGRLPAEIRSCAAHFSYDTELSRKSTTSASSRTRALHALVQAHYMLSLERNTRSRSSALLIFGLYSIRQQLRRRALLVFFLPIIPHGAMTATYFKHGADSRDSRHDERRTAVRSENSGAVLQIRVICDQLQLF
jgi:hypothetical protein